MAPLLPIEFRFDVTMAVEQVDVFVRHLTALRDELRGERKPAHLTGGFNETGSWSRGFGWPPGWVNDMGPDGKPYPLAPGTVIYIRHNGTDTAYEVESCEPDGAGYLMRLRSGEPA